MMDETAIQLRMTRVIKWYNYILHNVMATQMLYSTREINVKYHQSMNQAIKADSSKRVQFYVNLTSVGQDGLLNLALESLGLIVLVNGMLCNCSHDGYSYLKTSIVL